MSSSTTLPPPPLPPPPSPAAPADRDAALLAAATYDGCKVCLPLAEGAAAKVVRIVDGDTAHLAYVRSGVAYRTPCRLRDVNTPEIRAAAPRERTLAAQAREALRALIDQRIVRVTNVALDKYGRLLAHLRVEGGPDDGADVSARMLSLPGGLCRVFEGPDRFDPW